MQNGKPVDLLDSAEMFSEAMAERFCDNKNCMVIIASDGEKSVFLSFGNDDAIADALSTALYNNDGLFGLVQYSQALTICAKVNNQGDDDSD